MRESRALLEEVGDRWGIGMLLLYKADAAFRPQRRADAGRATAPVVASHRKSGQPERVRAVARPGFDRLDRVHAHLDHVLGLGGLIATLGLFDVRTPLSICGSGETIRFVEQYLASLYPLPRAPVPLQFVELQPGPIVSSGEFSVTCFPVRHRGTESLGYRFDTKPRGHVRADRLVALGVPAGPLRAQLAAGEAVVLPARALLDMPDPKPLADDPSLNPWREEPHIPDVGPAITVWRGTYEV